MRVVSVGLAAVLGFASVDAAADRVLGIYAGIGSWAQNYSGVVAAGGEDIDIEGDLDLSSRGNTVMYLAFEHPVPVLPNIRVQRADVATSGDSVLTQDLDWSGVTYSASDSIETKIDLEQSDVVMYYEVLDNVVSLDLGVAARYMDGFLSVRSETERSAAEFQGVVPMLYGKARVDLPFTGTWLSAEVQGIGYGGHSLLESNLHAGWESKIGLGFEAGWRMYSLQLDAIDDLTGADVDVDGPYAALNFHF